MADYVVTLTGKDNLSQTIKQVKSELNSVGGAASKIDQIQKKFEKIQTSTVPLKKQLKDLKVLMADMNLNGLSGTEQFTQIAQYAGKIQDAMQDASMATKRFADDTFALSVAKDSITALAGAGSALAGTLGLVGVESDKVQQAILKVQSAMAILNGVQAVANTLNKDSAMMQAIQAVRLKATTVATDGATAAQIRNNLAVLANPYVAAAAAIAALVAGLAYWASTMEDTTQEQETLNAAVDAFNEASEQQSNKLGEQLAVFEQLKKTYDESGGKTDILTNKILNNKEAQRKLGITLKTVDDVHRLFGKNSDNYIQASISRANALAAEAAEAALLGKTLAELSKIYTKLMKGEEVDWKDVQKAMEKAGISKSKAEEIIYSAGGDRGWDWINSNLEVDPDKIADFMRNVNAAVTDEFYKSGAGKILSELYVKNLNDADIASIDFDDLLTSNDKGNTKTTKSTKGGKGNKNTPDYEKGSLADLIAQREKLNKEIQNGNLSLQEMEDREKRIVELDRQIAAQKEQIAKLARPYMTMQELGLTTKQGEQMKFTVNKSDLSNRLKDAIKQTEKNIEPVNVKLQAQFAKDKAWADMKNLFKDMALEKQEKKVGAIGDAFASMGDILGSLGETMESPELNVAATIGQAIANYILGWTQATAQAAKLGPIGWAAFALSSLAQVAAVVAQIHSISGYATGGIIGGSSYSGDKLLARVNSGEMILNKRQQTTLFNAIASGRIGNGGDIASVSFRLRGSDIYGALKNYSAIKGKSGITTGIV